MRLPNGEAEAQLERFRHWLRDHRLPVTRPRESVARAIFAADGHPSADGLARALKAGGAPVGTATLYRTIDLLIESGLVRARDFGEGVRRFEPAAGADDHGHFVCERCGAVTEFSTERLERMLPLMADEAGFRLERHDVALHGVCRDCVGRPAEAVRR
ncbi:MAG TPA: Fur family transcriptional regulator [Gemmatimonadales bacterium]|nr:Fur family transcriptional regulator [Gemmatimonadales bacterium]